MDQTTDKRLDFPSSRRNGPPIMEVLKPLLGAAPRNVLEIASGSGQHAVLMASACTNVTWWPTDISPEHISSIDAWRRDAELENFRGPVPIDVTDARWRRGERPAGMPEKFDAIVNVNMIHISPPNATDGLIEGASRCLIPDGFLFLYGPFKLNNRHSADSNAAFDESLRARNPEWGVRDRADVEACAASYGFGLEKIVDMPANNLSLVFRKK